MSSRGTQRERAVATLLGELGYLVASLRHFGGPGDLLAVATAEIREAPATHAFAGLEVITQHRPLLVEVKGTTDVPWKDYKGFGRPRRDEMILAGIKWGVEAILAWWPPSLRGGPIWLPVEDWPS